MLNRFFLPALSVFLLLSPCVTVHSAEIGGTLTIVDEYKSTYIVAGSECRAGDAAVAWRTLANTCGDLLFGCAPAQFCTTGQHDWSPNGNYQETCDYGVNFFFGCQVYTCYASLQTKCEQSSSYVGAGSMVIGTMHVLEKPGNDGTVSCKTFCEDATWEGWAGQCIAGFRFDTKEPVGCDATNEIGLRCFCARLL